MTKLLTMYNTGDIGAKVEWAAEAFAPDLSISPATAFLSPHSETRFELTFHPTRVSNDIRYSGLRCRVEDAPDLTLSASGECMPQPESEVGVVTFDGRVREETSKKVCCLLSVVCCLLSAACCLLFFLCHFLPSSWELLLNSAAASVVDRSR
jgi:hypothetical protein